MANELSISAEFIWVKKDPDCSPCKMCKELMVTAKNVLAIETSVAGRPKNVEETSYAICNSCFDVIDNDE
jgi:hypothetical protein